MRIDVLRKNSNTYTDIPTKIGGRDAIEGVGRRDKNT